MQNQMDKNMENDIETGIIGQFIGEVQYMVIQGAHRDTGKENGSPE